MEKEAKHPVGESSIPRPEMLRGNRPHRVGCRPSQNHGFDLPVHSSHLKIELLHFFSTPISFVPPMLIQMLCLREEKRCIDRESNPKLYLVAGLGRYNVTITPSMR